MIEVHEPTYQQRKLMAEAGIDFDLRWGPAGCYLAAWIEARKEGRKLSVSEACSRAGWSPDALRQRRKHNADFRAAELTARRGQVYVPPVVDEPQDVVDTDPAVTDTTWPPRPAPPRPVIERPPAIGPTNTTLATPPAPPRKRRPTRRYTPPTHPPLHPDVGGRLGT